MEANGTILRLETAACAVSDATTPYNCIQYVVDPSNPAAVTCMVSCLEDKLGTALSSACYSCSQQVAACAARHCAQPCFLPGPIDSAECTACLCTPYPDELGGRGGNCLQDVMGDCAGFRPTAAEVGCPGG